MKYRDQVRNLLTNLDIRVEYLKKIASGATAATQGDTNKIINEIGYTAEKIRELVDLESNEERF